MEVSTEDALRDSVPVQRLQNAFNSSLKSALCTLHDSLSIEITYILSPWFLDPVCIPLRMYTGSGVANRGLEITLMQSKRQILPSGLIMSLLIFGNNGRINPVWK